MVEFLKTLLSDFLSPFCSAGIYGAWYAFLSGPKWPGRIRGWLENESWGSAYSAMVDALNVQLRAIFGLKRLGMRALGFCFIIAIVYAIFWFLASLAWRASDIVAIGIVALGVLCLLFLGIGSYALTCVIRRQRQMIWTAKPDRKRRLYAGIGYMAVAIAVAIGVATETATGFGVGLLVLLFLPVVNAIFDWLSWAVSRRFLERLGKDSTDPIPWRRWALLANHVLFDVLFALLALTGLAVCIAMVVGSDSADWNSLYNEPFSIAGSTYTIMLLSTLVPTALHLFCAAFALLPALPIGHRWIFALIPLQQNFAEFEIADRMILAAWMTFWSIISLAVVWLMFVGGMGVLDLMWSADSQGRNFWQWLLDIARAIQQWTEISL